MARRLFPMPRKRPRKQPPIMHPRFHRRRRQRHGRHQHQGSLRPSRAQPQSLSPRNPTPCRRLPAHQGRAGPNHLSLQPHVPAGPSSRSRNPAPVPRAQPVHVLATILSAPKAPVWAAAEAVPGRVITRTLRADPRECNGSRAPIVEALAASVRIRTACPHARRVLVGSGQHQA